MVSTIFSFMYEIIVECIDTDQLVVVDMSFFPLPSCFNCEQEEYGHGKHKWAGDGEGWESWAVGSKKKHCHKTKQGRIGGKEDKKKTT